MIFEGNGLEYLVKICECLPSRNRKLITHGKSNKSVFAKFPLKFKNVGTRVEV